MGNGVKGLEDGNRWEELENFGIWRGEDEKIRITSGFGDLGFETSKTLERTRKSITLLD